MTTPGEQIRAAREAGAEAAHAGKPPTANPHNARADNTQERVLADWWLRGYQTATADFPVEETQ